MSEFQYYEFYSVDRELTKKERQEVDELSSRFSPSSRRAVFTYSYSSFRHDEEKVLLSYFDFFLYLSNWGSTRIMYKFPKGLVDYNSIKKYKCFHNGDYWNEIKVYKKSSYIIVDISLSDEEGYWVDEENYDLSSNLIELRQDILEGDYRSLFLLWLHILSLKYASEEVDLDEEISEDFIPNGLQDLEERLEDVIDLFAINRNWVSSLSSYSGKMNSSVTNYAKLVKQLPKEVKDDYLLKLLEGSPNLGLKLKKELLSSKGSVKKKKDKSSDRSIKLSEIVRLVEDSKAKQLEEEEEAIKKEQLLKIQQTALKEEVLKEELYSRIDKSTSSSYDRALEILLDMQALYIHRGEADEFKEWLSILREEAKRKKKFIDRLDRNGL